MSATYLKFSPMTHHCPEPIGQGAPCVLVRAKAGPGGKDLVAPVLEPEDYSYHCARCGYSEANADGSACRYCDAVAAADRRDAADPPSVPYVYCLPSAPCGGCEACCYGQA